MEGTRLDRRHRLGGVWTKSGRHISRLRSGWEDHHARIGTKVHKLVTQGNDLNMEEHLHRMRTNEVAEISAHSERGRDELE
eukprot:4972358-Heterocapsa_arctica.AAC.1